MSKNQGRGKGVRPSSLAQFFDAPPQQESRAQQRRAYARSTRGSGGAGAPNTFGASNRVGLNEQRMLKQVTEDDGLGGTFGRADYKNDICLPRTEAQKILHRDSYDLAEDEIYVVVPEKFTIAGVTSPTNKKMKVPKVKNEYLMTPKERREFAEFELKQKEAVKLQQTAKSDKVRMVQLMKTQYKDGVIGMEKVEPKYGDPHPNVYKDKYHAATKKFERAVKAQESRKKHIVANSDSLQRRGYQFIHQTGDAPIQGAIAAKKAGGLPQPRDTHSRLFARETYKHNPVRAAALQQQETRGRSYDLISGISK